MNVKSFIMLLCLNLISCQDKDYSYVENHRLLGVLAVVDESAESRDFLAKVAEKESPQETIIAYDQSKVDRRFLERFQQVIITISEPILLETFLNRTRKSLILLQKAQIVTTAESDSVLSWIKYEGKLPMKTEISQFDESQSFVYDQALELNGKKIFRAAYFHYPPFSVVTKDSNGTVIDRRGVEVNIIKYVAEALHMESSFKTPIYKKPIHSLLRICASISGHSVLRELMSRRSPVADHQQQRRHAGDEEPHRHGLQLGER